MNGVEARAAILEAEREDDTEENQNGQMVKVTPADTGKNHPQLGVLRKRDGEIAVLEVTPPGEKERTLRVVFPTEGFEIMDVGSGDARL